MNYLYVGYYVDEKTFNQIIEKKINNMSVARQKFEYNLICGLSDHLRENLSVITYVPTNDKFKIPDSSTIGNTKIRHISINKKSFGSMLNAMSEFEKYLYTLGTDKLKDFTVIMYAVIPPFERVLLKLKKKYGIKIVTICSEVPELRRWGKSFSGKIKKNILSYYNSKFDGYIFFSAAMRDIVKCGNKPYMVLEGIAPDIRNKPLKGKRNIVMYAGGLARDNNVVLLAKCCQRIPEVDELWICGAGEDAAEIEQLSKQDNRIKYWGQIDNSRILELEEQAKLLVNLRSPDTLLTRYSFPSKILEYISTGSLVLSSRLVGIPAEYFEYIMSVKSTEPSEVIECISKSLTMNEDEYLKKVLCAQAFIRDHKNCRVQSKKVIEFVDELE